MAPQISFIGRDEEIRIISFLNTAFKPYEPLLTSLENSPFFTQPFDLIDSGYCLKMESEANELMGVAINGFEDNLPQTNSSNTEGEHISEEDDTIVRDNAIHKFLRHVDERTPVKDESILHLQILAVDPRWRRAGVGRKLAEATVELAKKKQLPGVLVTCTSNHSSRLFEKMEGFSRVLTVPYSEYLDNTGRPVFTPAKPHLAAEVYYLAL